MIQRPANVNWSDSWTHMGIKFSMDDPDQAMGLVPVDQMAYTLSNQPRWSGRLAHFYSVAQHSILVSQEIDQRWALQGLLHDIHEAFIGDVTVCMRAAIARAFGLQADWMDSYEQTWIDATWRRFELEPPPPDELKRADKAVLKKEMQLIQPYLVGEPQYEWLPDCQSKELKHLDIAPLRWFGTGFAFRDFLDRFCELSFKLGRREEIGEAKILTNCQ